MAILDTIKEHPKSTAAIAVGGILVLYLLFHAGSGSGTTVASSGGSAYESNVAAATDAYVAQLQAQQQSSANADALTAQQDEYNADITGLQIQQSGTNLANQLTAGVDLAQISATQQTTSLADELSYQLGNNENTLAAQVDENANATAVQEQQISSATTLGTAQTVANALVQESDNQTSVSLANISAAQATSLAQTQASEAVATQSWISKIF